MWGDKKTCQTILLLFNLWNCVPQIVEDCSGRLLPYFHRNMQTLDISEELQDQTSSSELGSNTLLAIILILILMGLMMGRMS